MRENWVMTDTSSGWFAYTPLSRAGLIGTEISGSEAPVGDPRIMGGVFDQPGLRVGRCTSLSLDASRCSSSEAPNEGFARARAATGGSDELWCTFDNA